MNYLAQTIIENATFWENKWESGVCKAKSNNRGNCIDELKTEFGKEVLGTPWCAEFVSVVVKTSCVKLKVNNLLPYTRSTAAMLDGAKKNGLRVDSTPAVGCVFYRTRSGGGHVGIVVKITDTGIITIEGNSDDQVKGRSYSFTEIAKWQFIHTEEMGGAGIVRYVFRDGVPVSMWVVGGVGALVGAWYWNKQKNYIPQLNGIDNGDRPSGTESADETRIMQSESIS